MTPARFILQTRVKFAVVGYALPPANVGNCLYLPHTDRRKTRGKLKLKLPPFQLSESMTTFIVFFHAKVFELNVWVGKTNLNFYISTYSYFCIQVRLFPRILFINKSKTPIKTKTTCFLLENAFFASTSKQTNCITGSKLVQNIYHTH